MHPAEQASPNLSNLLKKVNQELESRDLTLAHCGSKKHTLRDCAEVDTEVGYWKVLTAPPLRWIVHLRLQADKVVANLPPQAVSRSIAFANTAQGTTGALIVRTIPAILLPNQQYMFMEEWEWKLAFFFSRGLRRGSSAERFDSFNPNDGSLSYMKAMQGYIAAALITTNSKEHQLTHPSLPRGITYSEATAAVQQFIRVSPKFSPAP